MGIFNNAIIGLVRQLGFDKPATTPGLFHAMPPLLSGYSDFGKSLPGP
jgi:hypothetical protein